ncbi:MAG: pyridoxal phosphate-dependent aminotransferase [Actinobacteria bacterium]|nr:pyridoxal phosphate-dependent aminotransferase [Actinomycetota bacterium]
MSFDNMVSRSETDSIKWEVGDQDRDVSGREIIAMGLADMEFRAPQSVLEALMVRVEHGIFGYTGVSDEFKLSVVDWMARRKGWRVESEWLVVSSGAMPAINLLIQQLTSRGDGIIIQPPVFGPIPESVVNNGRTVMNSPLRLSAGRYEMDFDDLEDKASDPRSKMFLLCSPHNPVGRVWSRSELNRVADICVNHDLVLVSDEIHGDLVHPDHVFTSMGVVDRPPSKLVVCISASKTFNLPGLKTSITIVPDEDLRESLWLGMRNLNDTFSVNALGILATQTAFDQGEPWLAELLDYLAANLALVSSVFEVRLPQIRVIRPEATFLVWLDCRELGLDSSALAELIRREAGVVVEPGSIYGPEGEGFVRINIGCPRSVLEDALERMRAVLAELG